MKVAVVYTSTTPELIADLERELRSVMPADVTIANYQDPSILAEVCDSSAGCPFDQYVHEGCFGRCRCYPECMFVCW
jgi:hypothetical protein